MNEREGGIQAADIVVAQNGLVGVVREALGPDLDDVGEWTVSPLRHGPGSATLGVWRVSGEARTARGPLGWSVVLKVLRSSSEGHPNWRASDDVSDPYYWRREALAYTSGLVGGLSGELRGPRCLGVSEGEDGAVGLWMEDVGGTRTREWPVDRYGVAARHLGHAQGEFLTGRPLPNERWLCHGWLRAYVERHSRHMHLVPDAQLWSQALVRDAFPEPLAAETMEAWVARGAALDLLDTLPMTLNHNDVCPKNMFAETDALARDRTVLIDWAFLGTGPIAHDAANLLLDSLMGLSVNVGRCHELHELVVAGYLAGLRDAGYRPDEGVIRTAVAAVAAVKYLWMIPSLLRMATDEDRLARLESSYKRATKEIYAAQAGVLYFLRDLARGMPARR